MEGLERCIIFTDWSCNWSAKGYRLPTEAEWEKAARGGSVGMRFPWADINNITHIRANYYSLWEGANPGRPFFSYDKAASRGFNPAYNTGVMPYTCPVNALITNNYGLYNMAGNVSEWNYDWYSEDWYSQEGATDANTRGPDEEGTYRVIRGGSWQAPTRDSRCAAREGNEADGCYSFIGFRCARNAVPEPSGLLFLILSIALFRIK